MSRFRRSNNERIDSEEIFRDLREAQGTYRDSINNLNDEEQEEHE